MLGYGAEGGRQGSRAAKARWHGKRIQVNAAYEEGNLFDQMGWVGLEPTTNALKGR
jgi:hypothetical protein